MRDFLAATRERVVVFDGGMGATLEQFDLTLEDDYRLPGKCHEALVLQPPRRDRGRARVDDRGRRRGRRDRHLPGSRLKLDEWGLGDHTLEINRKAAEIARRAVGEERFVAGSIGPTGFLPASDDPTLGQIRFRELVDGVRASRRAACSRAASTCIIIETAQDILEVKAAVFGAREAFKAARPRGPDPVPASRCCPTAARCCWAPTSAPCWPRSRRWRSTRSASTARPAPRTCATRSASSASTARAGALHPQRRPAAAGPQRRDDLPRGARAAGRRARRVRRALRRRRSSAAAAARRPSTSSAIAERVARPHARRSAPRRARRTSAHDRRRRRSSRTRARRSSASA